NWTQVIYWGSELSAGGATGPGTLSKISFRPNCSASTANFQHWEVYIATTTKNSFSGLSDYVPVSQLTKVFDGNIPSSTTAGNWIDLTFSTPFFWDGSSNLVVAVHENSTSYLSTSTVPWYGYTANPTTGSKAIYFYQDGSDI